MKNIISALILILGFAQFFYYGYNAFTFLILMLCSFVFGLLAGINSRRNQKNVDSENLNTIAQIERNKYFGGRK